MLLKALPFLITTVTYLVLGAWIVVRHPNKGQRLYGVLGIATGLWQMIWVAVFSNLSPAVQWICIRLSYTSAVLIPAIFYHFIVEFTQKESHPRRVLWAYAVSVILGVSIWIDSLFIGGFYVYPWGHAAKAGIVHPVFLALVAILAFRMWRLLLDVWRDLEVPELKRHQAGWVMAAFFIYSLGTLDVLTEYGVPLYPLSCLFTGIAFGFFSYAIFRYELLAIATPAESEDERRRRLAASEEMARLHMAAAFPLVTGGELLGYLLLGEKMSEESYSKEDLLLLRIVANQVALAYQRVRYLELAVHGARTEMLGEIAGGFAHEIKTPLANISLPAELTYMDLMDLEHGRRKLEELLPELKQRMKDIMEQSFKASDKIEAVRQFSKPGQVQMGQVDLTKVLQNSLTLLDHVLKKLMVDIRVEFPATIPMVRGDAKQLEIVFINLIKNAAEAMAQNPSAALARRLWLSGQENADWVVVRVKDSGPGIKHTDVGHLFEAYFTTKGSTGTGIGLFLSQQVIKAHGGTIEVNSEEGRGTEFVIRLPKYLEQSQPGIHAAA
jgi:signal transduction histidine kinase